MIEPKQGDEGRLVNYWPRGIGNHEVMPEVGEISSWNEHMVFVRYHIGGAGIATPRQNLTWVFDRDTI